MSKRKHDYFIGKALKIPKSDFPSLSKGSNSNALSHPPLLLLQLPSSLSMKDLSQSQFITKKETGLCRLVSDEKTFDLVKVETSNSYVLLNDTPSRNGEADSNTNTNTNKSTNTNTNSSVKEKDVFAEARLLRENNTFFLECIESKVNLESEISAILKDYMYPMEKKGICLDELSSKLMHSKIQIQNTLDKMKVFKFQEDSSSELSYSYGVLSEETEREVWFVIQGVLSEWEGGADYAGKGVILADIVKEIIDRTDDGVDDLLEESVIRYCLQKCCVELIDGCAKLSVNYIARILAHYIFNEQKAPWEEKKFIERWHNLIPGVGPIYEPDLQVLKGICFLVTEVSPMEVGSDQAITNDDPEAKSTMLYQKYFPLRSLPTTPEGRFKALFHERTRWKLEDMAPYLEDLLESSSSKTIKELLVKFSRVQPKEEDDTDNIDWYIAK